MPPSRSTPTPRQATHDSRDVESDDRQVEPLHPSRGAVRGARWRQLVGSMGVVRRSVWVLVLVEAVCDGVVPTRNEKVLDNPRQHELADHLIAAGRFVE